MTTKVDPTVEKKRYEIKCYKCGHLLRTYTVPYYYDDEMEQECYCYNCFSNSVQEAKAERDGEWEKAIKLTGEDEEVHISYSCHVCGGVGDFLPKLRVNLASLKQEEEVC